MDLLRALLACSTLTLASACAQEPLTVKATGHPDWPPYSWQHDGAMAGIGVELTRIILGELGIRVEFQPMGNWKRAQTEVEAGKFDLLVACYETAERRISMRFPASPYARDDNVVWVAKDHAFPLHDWSDLIGKTGTAMLGDSFGQRFDEFSAAHLKLTRVNTPQQNLQKLVMGRADYYPFSVLGGQIQVARLGFTQRVEHLPMVLSSEGVYLCISTKSPLVRYLPQIEAITARLRASGALDRLLQEQVARASAQR